MPGLASEVVDTTGSGDIFGGAFAYGLLQGYDLEKAITFANIAAGLSVSKVGIKESIPEINEVMNLFNQKYAAVQEQPAAPAPQADPNAQPPAGTPPVAQ